MGDLEDEMEALSQGLSTRREVPTTGYGAQGETSQAFPGSRVRLGSEEGGELLEGLMTSM